MAAISGISTFLGLLCIGCVLIPGLGYFPPPGGVDLGSAEGLGICNGSGVCKHFFVNLTKGKKFEDWTESPWIRFKKDLAWSRLKKNALWSGSWARRRNY